MSIPKKYTAKLSRKDKKKQLNAIKKSKDPYKKGKYYTRPKNGKSFKKEKSSWTQKFHKLYPKAKTLKQIEKATIPKKALMAVKKKVWEHIILLVQDLIKLLNLGAKQECMLIY